MKIIRPINTNGQPPTITQRFGGFHTGIDYAYPDGKAVYATADGIVTIAKNSENRQWLANTASDPFKPKTGKRALSNDDYGNMIKIGHEEGYSTLYAHLRYKSVLVKVGDIVKKGQKIAEVGSTGNSSGNHLHFELRLNDLTQDPAAIMDTAFTGYFTNSQPPMSDYYKGLDLNNKDSMKVAVDEWANVRDGKYVKKENCENEIKKVKQQLENVKGELSSLSTLKKQADDQIKRLQEEVNKKDEELKKMDKMVKALEDGDIERQNTIAKLSQEVSRLQEKVTKMKEDSEEQYTEDEVNEIVQEELAKIHKNIALNYVRAAKNPLARAFQQFLSDMSHGRQ